ncbi:MAG: hypothetical protein IJF92_01205 [Bacilli bacterium]|nr:hypothetical protein [Bacilli bacterium]
MKKKKNKKSLIHKMKVREVELTILFVILIVVTILISAYFIFSSYTKDDSYNIYKVGSIEVKYQKNNNDVKDTINIVNETPILDKEIKNIKPISLVVKNTSNKKKNYRVYIEKDNDMIKIDKCINKQYDTKLLKYKIDDKKNNSLENMNDRYLIYKGSLKPNSSKTHNIKVWLSKELIKDPNIKGHFHAKVVVHSSNEKEIIP